MIKYEKIWRLLKYTRGFDPRDISAHLESIRVGRQVSNHRMRLVVLIGLVVLVTTVIGLSKSDGEAKIR